MFPQEVDAVPSPVFSPVLIARPRTLRVSHHLETFHPVTVAPLPRSLRVRLALGVPPRRECERLERETEQITMEDSYGRKDEDFTSICSALRPRGDFITSSC